MISVEGAKESRLFAEMTVLPDPMLPPLRLPRKCGDVLRVKENEGFIPKLGGTALY